MLPKNNRLKKRKEFGYVYRNGKYSTNEFLTLIYVPTKLKNSRIGFSVSKKIGDAVVRNKTKRQLREIVRTNIFKIDKTFNYIFVAKPAIVSLDFEQKKLAVFDVLTKAKKINE